MTRASFIKYETFDSVEELSIFASKLSDGALINIETQWVEQGQSPARVYYRLWYYSVK